MRTVILSSILIFCSVLQAQYTVTDGSGNVLTNGSGYRLVTAGPVHYVTQAEEEEEFAGTIFEDWDWEGETLGAWTDEEILTFGADEDMGFNTHNEPPDYLWWIVSETINGVTSNAMRTKHVANETDRPAEFRRNLTASHDTLFSSWNMKFSDNWTSSGGAKNHGLRSYISSGCPGGDAGFSAYSYTKLGGTHYPYFYEHTVAQPSCPWNFIDETINTDILFNYGNWYTLTQMIIMNTGSTGSMNSDGVVKWWIDGRLIYEEYDLRIVEVQDPGSKINCMGMLSFHGPGEGASVNDCYLYTDNNTFWMPTVWDADHSTISTPNEITDRTFYTNQTLIDDDDDDIVVSAPAAGTNYMGLIEAAVGQTITVSFSSGTTTSNDYLVFYDGDQTDDDICTNGKLIGASADLSGEFNAGSVSSTGNKMFWKYIVDSGGSGGTFTGNVTFITP